VPSDVFAAAMWPQTPFLGSHFVRSTFSVIFMGSACRAEISVSRRVNAAGESTQSEWIDRFARSLHVRARELIPASVDREGPLSPSRSLFANDALLRRRCSSRGNLPFFE
jgi:hypothetical protein